MRTYQRKLVSLITEFTGKPASGVELGVFRGETSVVLAEAFPECRLTLVDQWKESPPGSPYYLYNPPLGKMPQQEWDVIHDSVCEITGRFPNVTVRREPGDVASHSFPDGSLDFVFIDADHTYEAVKRDIGLWTPKARSLICGHDIDSPRDRRGVWGVRRAVEEAFGKRGFITRLGHIWAVVK